MIVYIAMTRNDGYDAKRIVSEYQTRDTDNLYLSAFSSISGAFQNSMKKDIFAELRRDLISVCDQMIVFSDGDITASEDIDFANLIEMVIEWRDYD